MKELVPDSVLNETTRCPHNFSCLETSHCGNSKACEVSYADGPNVLFLNVKHHTSCPYRVYFGNSQICRCPTHYALHAKKPS